MSENKAKLVPIREPYSHYLTNNLGYTKEECEKAWEKAQRHFPRHDPKSKGQLMTLEIVTRDILRGDFRPELAEVEDIGK